MQEDRHKGLESLQVWQRAQAYAVYVCQKIIPALPAEEKYALAHQLRRAAQSIPANIAEGYGRYYYQDNVRFCYIARGSLEETFSHLALAHELGYLQEQVYTSSLDEIKALRRLLSGYIAYLKRSKRGSNEPGASLRISEDFEDDHYESDATPG